MPSRDEDAHFGSKSMLDYPLVIFGSSFVLFWLLRPRPLMLRVPSGRWRLTVLGASVAL